MRPKNSKKLYFEPFSIVKLLTRTSTHTVVLSLIWALLLSAHPAQAHAGSFLTDTIKSFFTGSSASAVTNQTSSTMQNSRTMEVLDPRKNQAKVFAQYESVTAELVLDPDFADDFELEKAQKISSYMVRQGDTLSSIAGMFNITVNTLLWTNNLTKTSKIQPGDTLVILPLNGVTHKVVKGDTLASIAKQYKGDADEILSFNSLTSASSLKIGATIVVPNGERSAAAPAKPGTGTTAKVGSKLVDTNGYFIRPVNGGVRSRGIHGFNGVDLAAPKGTPIYAAHAGTVTVSRGDGSWNGGYGNYVVISHTNGTQTLYAHMSSTAIGTGASVDQGEVIGYVGTTGKSTGNHLHFEVRGGTNPF